MKRSKLWIAIIVMLSAYSMFGSVLGRSPDRPKEGTNIGPNPVKAVAKAQASTSEVKDQKVAAVGTRRNTLALDQTYHVIRTAHV